MSLGSLGFFTFSKDSELVTASVRILILAVPTGTFSALYLPSLLMDALTAGPFSGVKITKPAVKGLPWKVTLPEMEPLGLPQPATREQSRRRTSSTGVERLFGTGIVFMAALPHRAFGMYGQDTGGGKHLVLGSCV